MEGKLIKLEESKYTLVYKEGNIAWENNPAFDGKLSLKNCQAIENGYDLDELAVLSTKEETTIVGNQKMAQGFIKGFQKALEILGDKKFSEKDMRRALSAGLSIGYGRQFEIENKQVEIDSYIKSLQQTEWDVEIEMWFHGTRHKKGEWIPKLDVDGCLILKRK